LERKIPKLLGIIRQTGSIIETASVFLKIFALNKNKVQCTQASQAVDIGALARRLG